MTLAVATFIWSAEVRAFCTLTDCEDGVPPGKRCETEHGCIVEGIPLHADSSCFEFAVAEGHGRLVGLSDWQLETIIERAYQRWQSVDCGGGKRPGFEVHSAGVVPTQTSFACNYRRFNVDVWLFNPNWERDSWALGYTVNTHAAGDSEIFDADVELNLTRIATEIPAAELEAALLSVATHEAGHVLGLSHSNDPSAVMAAEYGTPQDVRELTADDVRGICSLFPADATTLSCPEPHVVEAAFDPEACRQLAQLAVAAPSNCAVGSRGRRTADFASEAAVALALAGLRRRRARRPKGV